LGARHARPHPEAQTPLDRLGVPPQGQPAHPALVGHLRAHPLLGRLREGRPRRQTVRTATPALNRPSSGTAEPFRIQKTNTIAVSSRPVIRLPAVLALATASLPAQTYEAEHATLLGGTRIVHENPDG